MNIRETTAIYLKNVKQQQLLDISVVAIMLNVFCNNIKKSAKEQKPF